MEKILHEIVDTLAIIEILKKKFRLKYNNPDNIPYLYCGVTQSDIINEITPEVEKYFGVAYKKAGESTFLKNLFDSFIKEVGGIRKEQTLFRKDFGNDIQLYCAFWPWGSNPVKTSVRIGLLLKEDQLPDNENTSNLKKLFMK